MNRPPTPSRRRLPRILVLLAVAALLAPLSADAAVTLRGVDASGYPTIRATLVAPVASDQAPTLTENGHKVVDANLQNLASSKSVVVAVDRSQSMAGDRLAAAVDGARAFVADKAGSDRVAIVVFGNKAVKLTGFSSSTIDADDSLRTMSNDSKSGTALYDALALSTKMLSGEGDRARVVVLLTDGKDVSSQTSLKNAIAAAKKAGVIVYPIGIGASAATRAPLEQMANATGGNFHGAADHLGGLGDLLLDLLRASPHLADRVRHRRAPGRGRASPRVARPGRRGLDEPDGSGKPRARRLGLQRPSLPPLLADGRARCSRCSSRSSC